MKKSLVVLFLTGVVSLAGAVSAQAQSADAALVKVPFQFIVSGKVLPAGSYRISAQTPDAAVLLISSLKGSNVAAVTLTQAGLSASSDDAVRVAFTKYGGQYFLSMVSMPGEAARAVVLSPASAEQALARLNLKATGTADTAAK